MSYNHNGGDNLSWYINQQVSLPIAISTSNDVAEGVKATASTDTSSTNPTPTEFQTEWPYENSQHVEGSSQGWYPTSDLRQNTAVLPQMPRSPCRYSSNIDNFDTQVNGGLPSMTGLEIYSTPDEILYNPSLQNDFGSANSSVSQQDTPLGEFSDEYNMDSTTTGFRTPVPSKYQTNTNSSVGSDTPAGLQSSIQVDNPPFGNSTQFASSTQNGEAPQQESTSQGEQYQAVFFNEIMTAQLNRPLSAPPAGHWVLEQGLEEGLSYTATGLDIPLPLNHLPRATPKIVPLAYYGHWEYDGSSTGPEIDSDVSILQPSNDIRNDPSGTLGQDTGAVQGTQPQQQPSQNNDLGQDASVNISASFQQSNVSSTRSPIQSDRRRHSDPASVPARGARESQQGVRVPSQLSEQAAQYQAPSINTPRALQQSGALIEDALGAMGSRRLSDTSPVPAQELHDTNPSPTGFRTEPWRMNKEQAASQSDRVAQQPSEHPVAVHEFNSSYPVGPHMTFVYPERSNQNIFQQPAKQRESASFTSGSARLREIARPPMQLLASAPPAVTPQQQPTQRDRQPRQSDRQSAQAGAPSTQQSQRVPRRRPHRFHIGPQADSPQAQGTGSQPRIPQNRFDRKLPSRLNPKAAAFSNVEPAEDFMKTLSKMHFLDKVACVDRLMREDLFKSYMNPHLFREYSTGHEDGLKFDLERRIKGEYHGMIENTGIKHERQNLKWKTTFDDKQIENERRRRELAARTAAGGMTTDTSDDIGMTPAGSKRRHQTLASAPDSHYEIDDDDVIESDDGSDNYPMVHPRNSPKKPRTSEPTSSGPKPSDITDKFCSHAVENIPFLPDPIHSQLRVLSTEQLIIPVQEYITQNGEIADTNVEHWRACAGQAAGTEMEQEMACTHCADHMQDGSVPFASCVVIGASIPAGKHFKGACMNCVYLGKDQDCSLREVESEENEAQ
ncbi:uncharacterized protein EAF02_005695 [Botrytis sinoallii]|uniref:uncharacterized protein n=1 Tax=Botrytis sinoallii TaxID=1463999 RepID=UPI001901552E|nr:uncharacterized protein EAF02_005695 [Botrytis sinoallii]KAF7882332.1 hypothetical protein EAF02_005695 [Botrytis sinoallii]